MNVYKMFVKVIDFFLVKLILCLNVLLKLLGRLVGMEIKSLENFYLVEFEVYFIYFYYVEVLLFRLGICFFKF